VRFSLSRNTTESELGTTLDQLDRALARISSVQPAGGGPVVRRATP
jgi:cysteine sulfinate desulfinase/cysteine desulfurase-like protein